MVTPYSTGVALVARLLWVMTTNCVLFSLAVSFAAVLDREYLERVAKVMVTDSVVADAEAKLGRFDILEALNVAFASGEEAGQCVKDTEGCRLINSAKVGLGFVGPRNRF